MLGTIADDGDFPAPRLVAAARRPDTLPYLFMTALEGEAPDRSWTGYTAVERLGLAVAREMVEAHGGKIELDSGATPGATFRVTLPVGGGDVREPAIQGRRRP